AGVLDAFGGLAGGVVDIPAGFLGRAFLLARGERGDGKDDQKGSHGRRFSAVTGKSVLGMAWVKRRTLRSVRAFYAGLLYFSGVFAAGFLLGAVRVLWAGPRIGERAAELLEVPLM